MTNREKLGLNTTKEIVEFINKHTSESCDNCPAYNKEALICRGVSPYCDETTCKENLVIWLDEEYNELNEFIKENKDKIIDVGKGFNKICDNSNICGDCPMYKEYGTVTDCFKHYIELVAKGEIK